MTPDDQIDGKIAFPVSETKFYRLIVEKSGYTYAQRSIYVEKGHAFAVDPVFLTQLDPFSNDIGSSGGQHTNSTGDIIIDIPPGAVPVSETINVSATRFKFANALPGPLPETSHFTTAIDLRAEGLDGISFETPVRVLVDNFYNIEVGATVPVGYYRKDLGIWVPDGMGKIIEENGQTYMEFWAKHFSPWDLNYYNSFAEGGKSPENAENTTPDLFNPCNIAGDESNSKVIYRTGELFEDYYLPSYKVLGKTIAPRLIYRSFAADPKAFISTNYNLDTLDTRIPDTTEFTVKVAGTRKSVHFAGSEGDLKHSYLFDGFNYKGERLSTGVYPYDIELTNWYPAYYYLAPCFGCPRSDTPLKNANGIPIRAAEDKHLTTSFSERLIIENLQDSPFGAGWSLAGIPRLIEEGTGRILMTESTGNLKVFTPNHTITTAAGGGDETEDPYGDGGLATNATISDPLDVEVDALGNIYIADDLHNRVRKVDTEGIITTVAYEQPPPRNLTGVDVDLLGNIYFVGRKFETSYWYPGVVYKTNTYGKTTRVAGGGTEGGNNGDGGLATEAALNYPTDIAVDALGNIYITDTFHNRIRKVDTNGIITSRVTNLSYPAYDGGVALDSEGNLYFTDGCVVCKGNKNTIVAGNGTCGYTGDGGLATDAQITPLRIAVDTLGNLYISSVASSNHIVRKVDTNGIITTVAGGNNTLGEPWGDGGLATDARLSNPKGITVDSAGNLYIADWGHDRIRKVFLGDLEEIEYESPKGDYSTLVRNAGGTFTHTLKDGTQRYFSADGYLTSIEDTNSNVTIYDHNEVTRNLEAITYPDGQVLTLNYVGGLLQSIEDPAQRTTTFVYDGNGDLREIHDPEYPTTNPTEFTYTGNHLLHTKEDRENNKTQYNYDTNGYGLITSVVADPDGRAETTEYSPSAAQGLINDIPQGEGTPLNPAGPVLNVSSYYKKPEGHPWYGWYEIETDKYGRMLKMIPPAPFQNYYTEYEWGCDCGSPTKIIKPNGGEVIMTYENGNLKTRTEKIDNSPGNEHKYIYEYNDTYNPNKITDIKEILQSGENVTHFNYDPVNGNLLSIVEDYGFSNITTSFDYYTNGLLNTITDHESNDYSFTYYDQAGEHWDLKTFTTPLTGQFPAGTTTTYDSYDLAGNLTQVTDAEGKVTIFVYDDNGYVTMIRDHDQNETYYDYDGEGNLTQIRWTRTEGGNPSQVQTDFTYEFNRLETVDGPLANDTWMYEYDLNGNLHITKDPNGNSIEYVYDEIDRLETKTLYPNLTQNPPADDQVNYTYHDISNLIATVSDNDSSLTLTYYLPGWLEDVESSIEGTPTGTLSYTYYRNGNRKTMADDVEGKVTEYYYTPRNLLDYITYDPSGADLTIYYGYNHLGLRDAITYPNTTSTSLGYDEAGRLLNIVHILNGSNPSYVYTHDLAGNRDTMTDSDGLHDYGYDNLYRLTSADHPAAYPSADETYTYDEVGNRLTSIDYTDWDYNNANQLESYNSTSFVYDDNGNMTSKDNGNTTYEYDIENRLVAIDPTTGPEYKYDPFGRRIEKKAGITITRYLYDGEDILYELDGNDNNSVISRFTHGPGIDDPILMERGSNVYYYHTDGLGSITKITNESGVEVQTYTYDSFGKIVAESGVVEQPYTYTGRELDNESGLYYYRARYYDPVIGRFLSEDPIGLLGGDINFYAYVWNNPVKLVDPWGLASLETDMSEGTTTFDPRPEDPNGVPLTIPTSNEVTKDSRPGAQDPFKTPDVNPEDIDKNPAYGPPGTYLDTGDSRGRDIHGGGSGLKDPYAPRQGWVPTKGCTRGQNEDIQKLNEAIKDFKQRHPGSDIPYTRR